MSPLVAYCLAVGVGLILAAVLLEWSDAKEKERRARDWPEFDALLAARDVTGHVDGV